MSSTSSLVSKTRRRNAPLSCAECRRLKLKCSRVFPCSSCVKKGCAQICPDGSLTTGKGNRFVLANTEALHEKITILATRVRDLEDALGQSHSQLSHQPHPLLSEELLQLKRPLEREAQESQLEPEPEISEAIDAVGSLSITESGHTTFFGTTANAWYLLKNEAGEGEPGEYSEINLPTDLDYLNLTFPLAPSVGDGSTVRHLILGLLPEQGEAYRLAKLYYKHAGWMYNPVPEADFYRKIMSRFYDIPAEHSPGTLFDLDRPQLSKDASHLYQLGRAALSLDSVLESQSNESIQALMLMCHYMFFAFVDGPRWALMGIAVKLAQGLGLHRDSGKWNLDPQETTRRRALFYELYTYDSWQSLTFGRPPSFLTPFIDCQFPEEPTKNETGELEMSFAAWKHRFSAQCQSVVHEQAFGARVPNYRTILELDKKVRNFYVPPSLRVPGFDAKMELDPTPPSVELTMQRYVGHSIKENTIFYIHRGYFARAVEDHPEDPLSSKYGQSVLAAYNSACSFVALVRSLYSQHPELTQRMWFLFTHVFSCAVVLGAIPTKCPKLPIASNALRNLEAACTLFESVQSPHAAKVVPVLQKLKARAAASVSDFQSGATRQQSLETSPPMKEDEELDALGGKTRLVSRKSPAPSSPSQASSSPRGYSPQPLNSSQSPPSRLDNALPLVQSPSESQTHHANMYNSPVNSSHQQWQGYESTTPAYQEPVHAYGPARDVYGYTSPTEIPQQWLPQNGYDQMQHPMITGMASMQYPQYYSTTSYASTSQASYPQQDIQTMSPDGGNMQEAWRNLYQQFGQ